MFEVLVARSGRDVDAALLRLNRDAGLIARPLDGGIGDLVPTTDRARSAPAVVVFSPTDEVGRLDPRVVEAVARLHERAPRLALVAVLDAPRPGDGRRVATAVALLDAGADDVLDLDVEVAEYLARMRALVRRVGWRTWTADVERLPPGERPRLDPAARRLVGSLGTVVLTAKECVVMAAILEVETVATRAYIGRRLWTDGWYGTPKAIDMHISKLRPKLRSVSGDEWRIVTVRGSGFRLVPVCRSQAIGA